MEAFDRLNISSGRMISYSKTGYLNNHPFDLIIFNAQIKTKDKDLFAGCDVNLTEDSAKLLLAAQELGEDLYVLYESGNFENSDFIEISAGFKNKLFLGVDKDSADFYRSRFSFGIEPKLFSEFHGEAINQAERSQKFRLGRFYDVDFEKVGIKMFLYFFVYRLYLRSDPDLYEFSDKVPTPIYSGWRKINNFLKRKSRQLNS